MTVYMDPLRRVKPTPEWPWPSSSHLVADSLDELHEFAGKIGLRRAWFQDGRHPHYDLTAARRRAAVRLGAVETSSRFLLGVTARCRGEVA